MLVGREKELNTIEGFYQGAMRLKVMLVEGRPGSGKTALCREFIAGKPAICIWDPSATDERANLRKAAFAVEMFIKKSADKFPLIDIPEEGFKSWGRFFSCLCAITTRSSERVSLVIDDYPTLYAASPSFADAFDAAVDVLGATRLFMLLNASSADLPGCRLPMSIDAKIATSSSSVLLRTLGSKAVELGKPKDGAEYLSLYAQKGGVPSRYTQKKDLPASKILESLTQGEQDAPAAKLFSALCTCERPVFGLQAEEAGKVSGMGRLEAMRVFKSMKRLDLVSSEQLRWYEAPDCDTCEQDGDDGSQAAPKPREMKSDRIRLRDLGDIAACRPGEDWTYPALLDLAKSWMWEALRSGCFPNEFEELAFWMEGSAEGECRGILGVNGHYRRIVGCTVLRPGEELTVERLDAALAAVATLPYKVPHCAVVTTVPVDEKVMEYVQGVRNLTVGVLGASGIEAVACPWQQFSERYKANQARLSQSEASQAPEGE